MGSRRRLRGAKVVFRRRGEVDVSGEVDLSVDFEAGISLLDRPDDGDVCGRPARVRATIRRWLRADDESRQHRPVRSLFRWLIAFALAWPVLVAVAIAVRAVSGGFEVSEVVGFAVWIVTAVAIHRALGGQDEPA